jgi:hypothetical protein
MRESQKIFNQIFKKFNIIERENIVKLIIYIELLLEHGTIQQEESYKNILIFYKMLMESVNQCAFTSNIIISINNILNNEAVYIHYSELTVNSSALLEKIIKILLSGKFELPYIIDLGINIGINNDNKYIINGIVANTIKEGLWLLAASTVRSFLNIDSDRIYGYTYIY